MINDSRVLRRSFKVLQNHNKVYNELCTIDEDAESRELLIDIVSNHRLERASISSDDLDKYVQGIYDSLYHRDPHRTVNSMLKGMSLEGASMRNFMKSLKNLN